MHSQTPNTDLYRLLANVIDLTDVSLTPSNKKYTFYEPNWYFSTPMMKFLKKKHPNMDVETLFLTAPFRDIISGAVQDMQYWIDRKYVDWKPSTEGGIIDTQVGFLPTEFDENSLSMANIKLSQNSFIAPKFKPIFFVVNNIKGKTDTIWTLTNVTDPNNVFDVIKIKGAPYFIWRFPIIGTFSLTVETLDNNSNTYVSSVANLVTVVEPDDYIRLIEASLDRRKVELIKSGANLSFS
jgi:hypothetical protein